VRETAANTPTSDNETNMESEFNNDTNNITNAMVVDSNEATTSKQSSKLPQQQQQMEAVPLLDYITNIMKFIESILSNNLTDDHCKEFVKQKGLVPLLKILSLPNLPIDFPNSTACQSVAQVCKAILHLAREPQVIDQTLESLAEVLGNCETLYMSFKKGTFTKSILIILISFLFLKILFLFLPFKGDPDSVKSETMTLIDGSILIRELANASNPIEAVNYPNETPLLHSICSIHSFIYLLITLGKINQNDVRNLTISKWGSELGVQVLEGLCKLYMNLIWESSMLLWLCNEDQQQHQLHQLQQVQQISTQLNELATQTTNHQLSHYINQLSATAAASSNNFEFNKNDLDKLRTFLATNNSTSSSGSSSSSNNLNSLISAIVSTNNSNLTTTSASTSVGTNVQLMETHAEVTPSQPSDSTTTPKIVSNVPVFVSYSKLLRPLFNSSSKLGRSLCEMFGLLVKLSAGSPWKNANNRRIYMSNNLWPPSQAAVNVATALADISISGFSNYRFTVTPPAQTESSSKEELKLNENFHPKFRLTFYICSVGFASSILFDEQKRPYHLMLQRFDQSGGLKSLFDAFYWSLSLLKNKTDKQQKAEADQNPMIDDYQKILLNQDKDKLQEGTLEFIEAWLVLIQKLVNTKNILETRHSINTNNASNGQINNIIGGGAHAASTSGNNISSINTEAPAGSTSTSNSTVPTTAATSNLNF
jgi:E3 ubiquitin-protein ligase HUWE1